MLAALRRLIVAAGAPCPPRGLPLAARPTASDCLLTNRRRRRSGGPCSRLPPAEPTTQHQPPQPPDRAPPRPRQRRGLDAAEHPRELPLVEAQPDTPPQQLPLPRFEASRQPLEVDARVDPLFAARRRAGKPLHLVAVGRHHLPPTLPA